MNIYRKGSSSYETGYVDRIYRRPDLVLQMWSVKETKANKSRMNDGMFDDNAAYLAKPW